MELQITNNTVEYENESYYLSILDKLINTIRKVYCLLMFNKHDKSVIQTLDKIKNTIIPLLEDRIAYKNIQQYTMAIKHNNNPKKLIDFLTPPSTYTIEKSLGYNRDSISDVCLELKHSKIYVYFITIDKVLTNIHIVPLEQLIALCVKDVRGYGFHIKTDIVIDALDGIEEVYSMIYNLELERI